MCLRHSEVVTINKMKSSVKHLSKFMYIKRKKTVMNTFSSKNCRRQLATLLKKVSGVFL